VEPQFKVSLDSSRTQNWRKS